MDYSEYFPTFLNPLAERTSLSQVGEFIEWIESETEADTSPARLGRSLSVVEWAEAGDGGEPADDTIRHTGMHEVVTSRSFKAFFASLIIINSALLAADHHGIDATLVRMVCECPLISVAYAIVFVLTLGSFIVPVLGCQYCSYRVFFDRNCLQNDCVFHQGFLGRYV
jgi:hypothetical protein